MVPRVTLPDGVKPVAAVVGAPGAFVSLGPADAYEPRPVLCLQPMTAADARYAEGRRAGLLEAAAGLEASAMKLETGETDGVDRLLATTLRLCAEALAFNAGKAG